MSGFRRLPAAATGTAGNNTHASQQLDGNADKVALLFATENAGTTITYKWQGTLADPSIPDGSAEWVDLPLLPSGSETVTAAPAAVTTQSVNLNYLAQSAVRFFRRVRLVTSANTGFTYHAEVHQQITH